MGEESVWFWAPQSSDRFVRQQRLAHQAQENVPAKARRSGERQRGDLNCVVCDEVTWDWTRVAVCARAKESTGSRVSLRCVPLRQMRGGWIGEGGGISCATDEPARGMQESSPSGESYARS
jgi:hypothetical protein